MEYQIWNIYPLKNSTLINYFEITLNIAEICIQHLAMCVKFFFLFIAKINYVLLIILTAFLRLVRAISTLDVSVASLIGRDTVSVSALELVPRAS